MRIASAAAGRPARYVRNNELCNGVRSVGVLFVFRFGGSPSGSPVVENMKGIISYSSTLRVRILAVPLGHAVAVPGGPSCASNNTNNM